MGIDGYDKIMIKMGMPEMELMRMDGTEMGYIGVLKQSLITKDGTEMDMIKMGMIFDRDGHNIDGVEAVKQFQITSKFSKIISSFNSDFDAFVK